MRSVLDTEERACKHGDDKQRREPFYDDLKAPAALEASVLLYLVGYGGGLYYPADEHAGQQCGDGGYKRVSCIVEEVQQAHALVLALEIPKFQPTVEDLSAFHDYLQEQQLQSQESAEQTMQGMSM